MNLTPETVRKHTHKLAVMLLYIHAGKGFGGLPDHRCAAALIGGSFEADSRPPTPPPPPSPYNCSPPTKIQGGARGDISL